MTSAADPFAVLFPHAATTRCPSPRRFARQDQIRAARPTAAVAAAQTAAPETALDEHTLTWLVAAAVLGYVTEHPHALAWAGRANQRAEYDAIITGLLHHDTTAAAAQQHPGHAKALDMAADTAGLTALHGLVYGWRITLTGYNPDGGEEQLDQTTCEGSWADAENAARNLLIEHHPAHSEVHIDITTGSWTATHINA